VVFVHGGGFVNEVTRAHWRFVAHLVREAGVRCIVPIYPLVPRVTAKDVVPAMGELLRRLLTDGTPDRLIVLGNSAGAGLALAAAQWLRHCGQRQPAALVLISPGVNAEVDRAEHRCIAARDPVQDIPGMIELARLWAGDLDVSHPLVSPLNGELHEIAPLLVFSGTADLLCPDSVALAAKARAAGVPVELHVRQGQPHNYVGLPTPEGRQARERIVQALRAQG
jgi:acetyl esterase/lipase